jgi:hypothetical protein
MLDMASLGAGSSTDLPFPPIEITVDEGLAGGSVVVFFGLEELRGEVGSLHELGPSLEERHQEICHRGAQHGGPGPLLEMALGLAHGEDFASAFQACSWAFYLARLQGFAAEAIAALNAAGSVELQSNAHQGTVRLSWAAHLANTSSVLPAGSAAQINLNAGYAWLSAGAPEQALPYFAEAIRHAYDCESATQLVLALTGDAEACEQLGDYERAREALELCRELTRPRPGAEVPEPALEVDQMVGLLHGPVSAARSAHPHEVRSWFEHIKQSLASLLPNVAASAIFVHLLGNHGGPSALISIGGTTTTFREVCFNAATVIGEEGKILLRHV